MTDVLRLGDVEVKVHPAAELFPMMSDPELEELAADIAKNELQQPIVYVRDELLDGRNRIAAIARIRDERRREEITKEVQEGKKSIVYPFLADPYGYVVGANLHRRHLTVKQKREVIAKVLKADPDRSDRSIGKLTKVDHKTVATVRAEQEDVGTIPHVATRTDTKGRHQPAKKGGPSFRSRLEAMRAGTQRCGELPHAEPAPATNSAPTLPSSPNAVPPPASEPEELRSLLQIAQKNKATLIR